MLPGSSMGATYPYSIIIVQKTIVDMSRGPSPARKCHRWVLAVRANKAYYRAELPSRAELGVCGDTFDSTQGTGRSPKTAGRRLVRRGDEPARTSERPCVMCLEAINV